MIDAKELRLGDYIYDKNLRPQQVSEITNFNRVCLGSNRIVEDLQNCTPIPLNEELLLMCGMNECNDDAIVRYAYRNGKLKMSIIIHRLKKYIVHIHDLENGEQICSNEILYLHQLQNIYFDLAGKELEVSL